MNDKVLNKQLIMNSKTTSYKWLYEFDLGHKRCQIYTNTLLDINDTDDMVACGRESGGLFKPMVCFNRKTNTYYFNDFLSRFALGFLLGGWFLVDTGQNYQDISSYLALILCLWGVGQLIVGLIAWFKVAKQVKQYVLTNNKI